MKKIILAVMTVMLFVGNLWARQSTQINKMQRIPTKSDKGISVGNKGNSSEEQPFVPFLQQVKNTLAAQNGILANTYVLRTCVGNTAPDGAILPPIKCNGGSLTMVRIHKNWFLTSMHGLVDDVSPCPKWKNKRCTQNRKKEVAVSVFATRWDAPGAAAPFALIIDLNAQEQYKTGKVYFLDPNAAFQNDKGLGRSNEGRGKDWALIYVPDQLSYLSSLGNVVPNNPYFSSISASLKNYIQEQARIWKSFIHQKIEPVHLLAVSDKTIIPELSPFTFTVHDIHTYMKNEKTGKFRTLQTFYRKPFGTKRNTNLILYDNVAEGDKFLGGVSGGPIAYGEYVISVVSKQDASPMYSDLVHDWVQKTMGSDYVKGLSIRVPEPPPNAILEPVYHAK